jgi:hypothetical protein
MHIGQGTGGWPRKDRPLGPACAIPLHGEFTQLGLVVPRHAAYAVDVQAVLLEASLIRQSISVCISVLNRRQLPCMEMAHVRIKVVGDLHASARLELLPRWRRSLCHSPQRGLVVRRSFCKSLLIVHFSLQCCSFDYRVIHHDYLRKHTSDQHAETK